MTEERKTNSLPRIRTIQQCAEEIRKNDAESAISEWFIRQLCKNGTIKSFSSGNKILINLDSLLEYLSNEPP